MRAKFLGDHLTVVQHSMLLTSCDIGGALLLFGVFGLPHMGKVYFYESLHARPWLLVMRLTCFPLRVFFPKPTSLASNTSLI